MKKLPLLKLVMISLLLVFFGLVLWMISDEDEIDYNTQIKPIINKNCIACHGGVKQSGGFSLLFEEDAKGNTASGEPAIVPGYPNKSELIRRLMSHDPEERMPYEKAPLSAEDIDIFKKWIEQGAKWDLHWSYVPVTETPATDQYQGEVAFDSWAKNEIDYFIYDKIQKQKLMVSESAELPILARRLSFDLIGLPPPTDAFNTLTGSTNSQNWDSYMNALLGSPHFGEKWAGMWLNLARYADTKGYERDDARTIWKYRDWLIRAFNEDKPYDQFLLEQIAGDLLPNPSDEQLIATAFHRNTMTNDEGGTDNEEYRVAAVMDRVNTTWEVTMGTTFSCVQCHGHPFDPFRHEDYYKFMAFFNNTRDEDTYDDYPRLRSFEGKDSLKMSDLVSWLNQNTEQEKVDEITKFIKTWQPSINSLTSDKFVNSELSDTKWLVFRNHGSSRLKQVNLDGKNNLIYRYRSFLPGGIWQIRLDSLNGELLKEIRVKDTKRNWTFDEIQFQEVSGTHDLYFTYSNPSLKNPQSNGLLFDWFYFTEPFPGGREKGFAQAKEQFWHLLKTSTLSTPIMIENPDDLKRETRVFERGNWLSPGDVVVPGLPRIMAQIPEGEEPDRLALAKWMVDTKNPLVARTFVNRVWEQLFGFGIVETLEDFGSQGISPTHQELLDHLSWKFMHEFDWSTKALFKYIVSSATYQQSAYSSPEHLRIDPQNEYYARGPRIRLTAEQLRDQVLVVSGLFSPKMYGPGVMPFQTAGIWNSPYSGRKWIQSEGEDQYRRALYTYWKRTSPYPSMVLFDVMAREVCASRRISTNTPLQALVTLNDSAYVEASMHFAKNMIEKGGSQPADQIRYGYKRMMYREISDEKLDLLMKLYNNISGHEGLIRQVAQTTYESKEEKHAKAMRIVANTMFNLDEFIMKN